MDTPTPIPTVTLLPAEAQAPAPAPAPLPPTACRIAGKVVDFALLGPLTVADWKEIKRRGGGDIVKADNLRDFGIDGLPPFIGYVAAKVNKDVRPTDIDAMTEAELGAAMGAYATAQRAANGEVDRPT